MKEVGDDTLSHVKHFVGGVLDSVHEDVALLGVSMKVHEQQHLSDSAHKRRGMRCQIVRKNQTPLVENMKTNHQNVHPAL